jgi:hypothetical protein
VQYTPFSELFKKISFKHSRAYIWVAIEKKKKKKEKKGPKG